MKESTILAQRLVYEGIHHEGGVRKVPIPLEMGVGRSGWMLLGGGPIKQLEEKQGGRKMKLRKKKKIRKR